MGLSERIGVWVTAAGILACPLRAADAKAPVDEAIPKPVITQLYLPAITREAPVVIEGKYFLPEPNASFEVRIGNQPVDAVRRGDGKIEIKAEVIGRLLRQLGGEVEKKLPVQVTVEGDQSNIVQLGFHNPRRGSITGRVTVVPSAVGLSGAHVLLPERGEDHVLAEDGGFVFRNLPSGTYRVVLHWPDVMADTEEKVTVKPGTSATAPPMAAKIPEPRLGSVSPTTLKEPDRLILRGKHFFKKLNFPYAVHFDGETVHGIRVSDQTIQIPTEVVLRQFEGSPGESVKRKISVSVAGVQSNEVEVTLQRPGVTRRRLATKAGR